MDILPNEILDHILSYTNWISSRVCYRWYELNRSKPKISDISSLKLLKWAKDYNLKPFPTEKYIENNEFKCFKYCMKLFPNNPINYMKIYKFERYNFLKHILSKLTGNKFTEYDNIRTWDNYGRFNTKLFKFMCKFDISFNRCFTFHSQYYRYLFKFNKIDLISKYYQEYPFPENINEIIVKYKRQDIIKKIDKVLKQNSWDMWY